MSCRVWVFCLHHFNLPKSVCVCERERGEYAECIAISDSMCSCDYMLIPAHIQYIWRVCKMPNSPFLILQDNCVSAGIPVLSGTWANVLCEILIAIVGGKGKKKLLHFSICFVRKQSRWIISWSFSCLIQLKSKLCWTCQIHRHTNKHMNTHTNTHTQFFSCLKYNRLLLINISKVSQFTELNQYLSHFALVWIMNDVTVFLPNIPHVPHVHRDMFVAFLFVAWETMLACLLTFHTWFHPLNP